MTSTPKVSDFLASQLTGLSTRFEELIESFELAWRAGSLPRIDDYLHGEGSEQDALLLELIHVDLEFRLKAGEAARVESYFARYPRLAHDRAAVLDLLKTEYELRQRRAANVDLDEYARRFPAYFADLRRRLAGASTLPDRRTELSATGSESELPVVPGYEIIEQIGRGGMGVVYRARQLGLDRTVALKMILTGFQAGPKDLARFRAEAAALARLQHPNIVQIYDVGEAAGRPYFVFEFVAGGSLAEHLQGTPQPVRPAAQLVETLARAVHAAHANGVIHRDLKPANILCDERRGEGSTPPSPLASRLSCPRLPTSAWPSASAATGREQTFTDPRSRESCWARPITWPPNRPWSAASRSARQRMSMPSGPSSMSY